MEKHERMWLTPSNTTLERIKKMATAETKKGGNILAASLLRLIATIRYSRGTCPTCGLKIGHTRRCMKLTR